jgi:hypothetical protein
MSLILKQEPANTIATPPAGKSTLFVNDQSVMSVKSPDGNVTTFPTVQGANTQVFFNDAGSINGNANLTFDKTTSTMSVTNLSVTGNLNAGDINVSSIANGTSNVDIIGASGNVTTSVGGQPNVFVVTTTGANVAGTLSATGNVTGQFFIGNGSQLTGIDATTIQNGNSNVQVFPNSAVTTSVAGTANILIVSATGMGLTGNMTTSGTSSVTGTATVGNLSTAGSVTAATVSASGNANAGNLGTTGVFATTLSASGNANVGNLGTGGLITATGNLNAGNIITGGIVSATGNVTGAYFIGNGSQLSGIDTTSIQNGNSNVQVIANSIITASVAGNANVFAILGTGIQANGTVSASGNVTAGNISTGGLITATGNVTGSNLVTAGSVFAPALVANSGAYDTRVTLGTSTGIIEANSAGNATQFLPSGQVRLAGAAAVVMGGTSDGSQLVLGTTQTDVNQLRGGDVTLQVGDGGTAVSVLRLQNTGNLIAPAAISAAGNITGGNVTTAGLISATGNVTGGNLTTGGLINATGNIVSGANVVTDLIVGKTSGISITATGTNQSISLVPTGTGTVNVGNFRLSNLADPIASTDAATKQYVDEVAEGLKAKPSVEAATTVNLTSTYNNGTAGVGATLTSTTNGAFPSIDGVTIATTTSGQNGVLVKNQSNAAQNGRYNLTQIGDAGTPWILTRCGLCDTSAEIPGMYIFVQGGATQAGSGWVAVVSDPSTFVIGTDDISFFQFSGAGTYTAGTGLTLTGSEFSITSTSVTPGAYGNGDFNATFTVNQQGQLTAAANVAITANAANLSGTTLKSTVVSSSLTSVGTLTSLSISGNANVGNIGGGSGVFSSLTGTLTTAAQTNITSVGVLTSLGVTGNANVGNIGTGGLITATGNIGGGNLVTGGVVTATGNITGGNVIGTLVTGTLSTAAQPNITSVGTLASLSVTANANIGNIGTAGLIVATGNITGGNLVTAGALSVTGNANIGNVGAGAGIYTTLSASGNVTGGNLVSTGQVGGTGATHLGNTFTTGANTTVGTVTGNFALSTGSRFQATYA